MVQILLLCRHLDFPKDGFLWTVSDSSQMILTVDPNPQVKKVKEVWDCYDLSDPNNSVNVSRVRLGMPPIDRLNIGVEYV